MVLVVLVVAWGGSWILMEMENESEGGDEDGDVGSWSGSDVGVVKVMRMKMVVIERET